MTGRRFGIVLVAALAALTLGEVPALAKVTPASPPSAPPSVAVQAVDGAIDVSWALPTATGGLPNTGYFVTCSDVNDAVVKTTVFVAAGYRTVEIPAVNGHTYTCTVSARNADGTGPASAPSAQVTPSPIEWVPYDIIQTAGTSTISLTWQRSGTASPEPAVTSVYAYCFSPDGGPVVTATVPTSSGELSSLTVSGVPANKTYQCSLRTVSAVGRSRAVTPLNWVEHVQLSDSDAGPTSATMHVRASAGQQVSVVATGGSFTGSCVALRFTDTDGTQNLEGCVPAAITVSQLFGGVTVGSSGGETITTGTVRRNGGVNLSAWVFSNVTGTIVENGNQVTTPTTFPGQLGIRTFAGTAGQSVSLDISANSANGTVTITAPDGSQVAQVALAGPTAFVDPVVLPGSGTYRISVTGPGTTTLQLFTVAANTGTIPLGGAAQPVTLATPGQVATRTFSVTAARTVSVAFNANQVTGAHSSTSRLAVRSAAGTELAHLVVPSTTVSGSFTAALPSAGTYTLVVDGVGDAVGPVTVGVS